MAQLGTIFICYRRDDSRDITDRIYNGLSRAFGKGKVFRDIDSIGICRDFRKEILHKLKGCRAVLVVIGPDWIETRLASADDDVRIEIEAALARKELPIIPVLVRNARMPDREKLPDPLKELVNQNASLVRSDPDFSTDLKRLIKHLRRALEASEDEVGEARAESSPRLSDATKADHLFAQD